MRCLRFLRRWLVAGAVVATSILVSGAEAKTGPVPEEGTTTLFANLEEGTRDELMQKCFADRYGDFFWQEHIGREKQQKIVEVYVRENLSGRALAGEADALRRSAREKILGEKQAALQECLTLPQQKSLFHYEQTLPQRIVVHTAASRLVGTDDAISLEQINQLVDLLFANEIGGWTPPYPVGLWTGQKGTVKTVTSRMSRLPGQFFDFTHRAQAAKFMNAHQLEVFEEVEKSPLTDLQFWQ